MGVLHDNGMSPILFRLSHYSNSESDRRFPSLTGAQSVVGVRAEGHWGLLLLAAYSETPLQTPPIVLSIIRAVVGKVTVIKLLRYVTSYFFK